MSFNIEEIGWGAWMLHDIELSLAFCTSWIDSRPLPCAVPRYILGRNLSNIREIAEKARL